MSPDRTKELNDVIAAHLTQEFGGVHPGRGVVSRVVRRKGDKVHEVLNLRFSTDEVYRITVERLDG